jgi:triphosphoribosyl-dephospho-CoA synthase
MGLTIGQCATLACFLEATAPKVGNVHRGADFDDLTYADLVTAAIVIGPIIEDAENRRIGETILDAVKATRNAVGTNANLGTILLLSPMAAVPRNEPLAGGIARVLAGLDASDSRLVYEAIRLANPGGLGTVSNADVAGEPPSDLVAAMRLAADRDLVARQYANNFHEVLATAAPSILSGIDRGWGINGAIVHAQLTLMSQFPDGLVARKRGPEIARRAADHAAKVLEAGTPADESFWQAAANLDFWLRSDGHRRNPGTTADLIAAGLFAILRDGQISAAGRRSHPRSDRPWTAEREVPVQLATRLIESQFPALAPARIALLGSGWDNTAYEVNGAYVFRFPRRQIAVDLLAIERRLLPAIAPCLPLSVPRPEFHGEPTDDYPWPFAGYKKLPGRTACHAALNENQRRRAAGPIARFLAALHAITPADAEQLGAGPDKFGRLYLEVQAKTLDAALEQLIKHRLVADRRSFDAIIAATPAVSPNAPKAVVHGDFYVRHILVDNDGRPTGVIDWGDLHVGNPAVDLSIAHGFLPANSHDEFRREYGSIEDETWRLARLRALFYAVVLTAFGHDTGDSVLVREGLWSLNQLARAL